MPVSNNFASSALDLNGKVSLTQPTALVWGPDGRLYVTENGGQINVLTVKFGDPDPSDDDNSVSFFVDAAETLSLDIQNHNDDGTENSNSSRQVTGIDVTRQYDADGNQLFVDASGNLTTEASGNTPAVTMYVTSSDKRIGAGGSGNDAGLDTNSGVITMLEQTGSDSWDQVDIVRGLPRSEENHATNGLEVVQELDAQGKLVSERAIVASGGNANTGAPSNNFAGQQEQPLSAAILEVDVTGLRALGVSTDADGRAFVLDLPTLDDPTRSGAADNNDPNGGNDGLNSARLDYDGLVSIYSPGYRNAYDVEVTEDGRVWTYDNGANNSWGGRPVGEAGDNDGTTDFAQDGDYIATNLNNGDGNSSDDINAHGNWNPSNNDNFHEITRSDDLDGGALSVGGNGPVATYTGPDGLTYVYGGHPNPTRAEGAKAGLLFSPKGGTDDAYLLVSNQSSYGEGSDDHAQVTAWMTEVEANSGAVGTGDLTKKVLAVEPGVEYDIYSFTDGSGMAVPSGGAAPAGGTLLGQAGLPADIADIVDWVNPVEGDYREAGRTDGALDSGKGSINGLAEYTSTIMDEGGVKMSGAVIASVYNGGDLIIMGRNADGSMSSTGGTNATAADRAVFQGAGQPLGLATLGDDFAERGLSQPFQGSVWSAVYGQNNQGGYTVHIEILQPANGKVPLAGSEIVDPDDWDLDGVDKYNDPFEYSAENGMALAAGQKIVLDFDPQSTEFNGTLAGNTGLLGAALDGPGSLAGPLAGGAGTDNLQEVGATANQDARTGTYLDNSGDLLASGEQADGLYDIAGNVIPGGNAPILQIKEVVPGTMVGQGNTARDALHTGFRPAEDVGRVVATVTVKNWVAGQAVADGQLVGMVYGDGTQSNFLRLVFGEVDGQPGLEVGYELGDQNYATLAKVAVPGLAASDLGLIDLRLEIDIDDGYAVRAFYRLGEDDTLGQTPFTEIGLGDFTLPAGVLQDVLTGAHMIGDGDTTLSSGAAIGVVAETSDGNPLQAIDFHNIEIEGFGHEFEAGSSAAANAVQGTSGTDTVVLTGSDAAPVTLASAVENIDASGTTGDVAITGNALDNRIVVGTGQNTITTGEGKDAVLGTSAGLGGTEITDFTGADRVVLTDATMDAVSGVTYAAGSAILTVNGAQITFSGPDFAEFDPAEGDSVFRFRQTDDGLEISLTPSETLIKAIATGTSSYTYHFDADGKPVEEGDPDAVRTITFDSDAAVEIAGDPTDAANYVTSGSGGGGGSKIFQGTLSQTQVADFGADALDELHWVERSSNEDYYGYQIPVPEDGTYRVDLYMAEIYHGVSGSSSFDKGDRVWDIVAEGETVADDFDLWEASGGQPLKEVKISFLVEVTDGAFTIDFDARAGAGGVDQPKLSGLALYKVGGEVTPPADGTAPQIVSIEVDNPQSVQDGERIATVILSDETGFATADFGDLDGSELVFSGIVPDTVSAPQVTLSAGGKTATLQYTLTAEGNAWATGEGQIGIAGGAYRDAAGNATGAASGAFILEPNLDSLIRGEVALAINVGPTTNGTAALDGDDDNTYGGAITNDTILGIDLEADDPSYYSPNSKTGSNIDGLLGGTGSNPALDGSALHTYRDSGNKSFTATYPIENGTYVVELWFAELYHTSGGNRQGDYTINGETWELNFDAFTEAGGADTPTMITKTVTVTDGQIVIDVDDDTGEPGWNAIVVYDAVPADLPPTVSVVDARAAEGDAVAVTFSRIGDDSEDVTIDYILTPGSASTEDYGDPVPADQITIPAGARSATVMIPIVDDDAEEAAESFAVSITGVSNASGDAVIADAAATVTIDPSDASLQVPAGGTLLELDFETAGTPLAEGGFDDVVGGAGALDGSVVTEVAGGKLVVNTSNGDLSSGDPVASKNDFVREIDLSDASLDEVYVTTQFSNPFTPEVLAAQGVAGAVVPNYAQQGIILAIPGANAQAPDNFVKLIFGGGGGNGAQMWSQTSIDQKSLLDVMSDAAVANGGTAFGLFDIATVELSLRIDKPSGEIAQIVTFYDDAGGVLGGVRPEATPGFATAAPQPVPATVLAAIEAGAVDVGVTSTDFGTGFGSFAASWDFLKVSSPQHSEEPAVDTAGPTATIDLALPDSGSDPIVATVVYADASDVDPASIDATDVALDGPSAAASASASFDADTNTATYTFAAPAGGWAEGDYTATVTGGAVTDLATAPNNNAGGEAAGATLLFEEEPVNEFEPGTVLYRVNAGGGTVAALDGGPAWEADTEAAPSGYITSIDGNDTYSGTATDSAAEILVAGENPNSNVDGSMTPEAIFFHERGDNNANGTPLEYTFPVEGGKSYYVTVYYTENWNGITTKGPRQFDVAVNGTVPTEFADINPYAEGDSTLGVARKRTFLVTQGEGDTDLALSFLHEEPTAIENPKVNGIEIVEAVAISSDILVSIAGPGEVVEDGDAGDQTLAFQVSLSDATVSGDVEVELSVDGVASVETLSFADGVASFEVAVPRDARWNGVESVSVEIASVPTAGYSVDPAASTASATILEDDPADSHDLDGAGGADPVVAGDYSDDRLAPSDIGTMQTGENLLYATQQGDDAAGGRDRDYITFEVPEGTVLSALFLDGYATTEDTRQAFMGLQEGTAVTVDPATGQPDAGGGDLLTGLVYGDGLLGNDLLPLLASGESGDPRQPASYQGFDGTLPAGTYTLWLNQGGAPTSVTLRAVVESAPVSELTLAIADADPVTEAEGATLDFALSLDTAFSGDVEVRYDTADATGLTQIVTFADGAGILQVAVTDDETDDGDDTVAITLTGATDLSAAPTPVTLGVATASGTVLEDDGTDPDDIDGDGIGNTDDPFAYDGANGMAKVLGPNVSFRQDFDTDTTDLFGPEAGFTGVLANPGFDPAGASETDPYGDRTTEAKSLIEGGALKIESSETDVYGTGTGADNTIKDNYQSAADVSGVDSFTVEGRIQGGWLGTAPGQYASFGITLGAGGTDDYVKFVYGGFGATPRLQLAQENSLTGIKETNILVQDHTPPVDPATVASVVFRIDVDKSGATPTLTGTAVFLDASDGELATITMDPREITGSLAAALEGNNPLTGGTGGVAYGVSITDWGSAAGNRFTGEWDYLEIKGPEVANQVPTVSLAPVLTEIAENADTTASIKVADIAVGDDGLGSNALSLAGTDAALFEIVETETGAELHLAAGTSLDFETLAQLDVTVAVDDPEVGTSPDATADFSLAVADVNEAPGVTLENVVSEIAEDADTTASIKVGDIVVTDDALGTNDLALVGTDAALFEIVETVTGPELHLRAGISLDTVAGGTLDVSVTVDDIEVGATPDASADLSVTIPDTANDAPTTAPIDAGRVVEDATPVAINLLQGAADSDGGTLEVANLVVEDAFGNAVAHAQAESVLTIDPAQFAAALALGESATITVSYDVIDNQGGSTANTATLVVDGIDGPYTWFLDADGDGYGVDDAATNVTAYTPPADTSDVAGDADDGDATIYPGAPEINDGKDNDQDGEIDEENADPVADAESFAARRNQPLEIQVATLLDGDTDADGDTLSVASVGNAVNGTVALAGGVVTFTPATDATGAASFDYTVSDGAGGTATQTVTIDIASVIEVTDPATPPAPTDEVDTVVFDGAGALDLSDPGYENLDLSGNGTDNASVTLNDGDNVVTAGTGRHSVKLGGGSDTVTGAGAALDGDSFEDFGEDDQIVVEGGAGAKIVSRESGSAIIGISDDGDDVADYTITLEGDIDPARVRATDEGGDLRLTLAPETDAETAITFAAAALSSYDDQDKTPDGATISGGGDTLTLDGNTWKRLLLDAPLTVEEGMTLAFDFSSADTGEIVGIGLETDNNHRQNGQPFFQLGGSDAWQYSRQDFNDYEAGDGPVTLEIPLDDWIGQTFSHLLFFADDDRNASTNAVFSGVRIVGAEPAENRPPEPADDAVRATMDTPLTIIAAELLANDGDPDGDPLTIVAVTGPDAAEGSVTLTGDGVVFTPAAGFVGATSFTYDVADAGGATSTATVSVTVEAVANLAPLAGDDTVTVEVDTPLTIIAADLLANDSDPEGTALTIVAVTGPDAAEGSVTLTGDDVVFTPATGFAGTTSFTYDVADAGGAISTATVTVEVETPSDPSVVAIDFSGPLSSYADQDRDPNGFEVQDGGATIAFTGNTWKKVALPEGFTVSADSVLRFQLSSSFEGEIIGIGLDDDNDFNGSADSLFQLGGQDRWDRYSVQDFNDYDVSNGVKTYEISLADLAGRSFDHLVVFSDADGADVAGANATFSNVEIVIRTEVNTDPVAADDSFAIAGGETLTLTAADLTGNDSDADGDDLAILSVGGASGGTATLSGGVVSFVPEAGFTGQAGFDYVLTDGRGGSATATVSIEVNTAPEAVTESFEVTTGDVLTLLPADLTANDSDADGHALTFVGVSNAVGGSVSFEEGQISFQPQTGYVGSASFDYTIADALGAETTISVAVDVLSDAEPGAGVTDILFEAGALSSYDDQDITANGATVTNGGATLELSGNTWKKLALAEPLTVGADTVLRFTFEAGRIGEIMGIGLDSDNSYRSTANQVLFQFAGSQTWSAYAEQGYSGYQSADGAVTIEIPLGDWAGQTFTQLVFMNDDDARAAATSSFSNVQIVQKSVTNAAPVAVDDTGLAVEGGQTAVIDPATLLGNDSDPEGDDLSIASVGNAVGGSVRFEDGLIYFTPEAGYAGDASFDYTIEDAFGGTSTASVDLVVNIDPEPVDDSFEAEAGTPLFLTPAQLLGNDGDPDGDALTLTGVGNATGGTVVYEDGQIAFVPEAGFTGTASFDYTVSDPRGGTATATVTVAVEGTDTPSGPVGIDFTALDINSYANQDEDPTAFTATETSLTLSGNTWKKVALPGGHTVETGDVLRFEFQASEIGEIMGIGLETNNRFETSTQAIFQLAGSQNWSNYARQDFRTYELADGTVTFEIALDEWAGQTFGHLVFINDDDADGTATGTFSNVQLVTASADLPPEVTSPTAFTVDENATAIGTIEATDPEGGDVRFAIDGGADAALFAIDAETGALSFLAAPDFEAPGDAGGDNVYDVVVSASDGTAQTTSSIAVSVSGVNEAPVVAGAVGDLSLDAGTAGSVDLSTLTLSDPDAGDEVALDVTLADGTPLPAGIALNGSLLEVADDVAEGSYQIAVRASDGTLQSANPVLFTVEVGEADTPTEPSVLLRINAFGPEVAATDGGPNWLADGNGNPNSPYLEVVQDRGDTQGYSGDLAAIPSGVPEAVLDTARSSDQPFSYNIPVTDLAGNGQYTVRLYLAELFSGNGSPGDRSFDVSVEGIVPAAFDDIDAAADGDAMSVEVREYEVTVEDGVLNLEFLKDLADNPIVNAIEIVGGGTVVAPDTEAPVAVMTLTNPTEAGAPILVDIALSDASGIDATTLGAEDLTLTVGGFPAAAEIAFTGFSGGVAQYEIAAPSGGWAEALEIGVTLEAGEIADLAAQPNGNAGVSGSLTIAFDGGDTGGETPTGYDATKELAANLDGDGLVNSADGDIDGDGIANLDDRAAYDAGNAGVVLGTVGEVVIDFTTFADGTSPFAAGFTGAAQTADGSAELDYATNGGALVTGGRLQFQTANPDTHSGQKAFTFLADVDNDFSFEGVFDNPVYGGSALATFSQYGLLISLTGADGASGGTAGDFFKLVTGNPGNGFEISGRGSFPGSGDVKIPYPAGVGATDFAQVKLTVQADMSAGTLTGFYDLLDETGTSLATGTVGTVSPLAGSAMAEWMAGDLDIDPAFGVTSTDYGGGDAFTVGVESVRLADGSPDPVDPPADPTEARAILQDLDDVDSGASYGAGAIGSAELRVMEGNNSVTASNYGGNSFQIENTGDKQIAAVFLDFRNALYGDSVVDHDGSGGDNAAKEFGVNSGAGGTGAFFEVDDAQTYFLPGADPLANDTGTGLASSGGWRGLLLKFDGAGFDKGEVVGFSGDMDPNSIAGLDKNGASGVDSGAVNGWDVGGVSGAELIGSAFTVKFDDGTYATGYLGGEGSQAGSVGTAVQNRTGAEVALTVNGFASDEAGTYGGTVPEIVVTGTPGEAVRVTLSRGVNPVTNTNNGVADLVDDRLAAAHPEFPVSNAADFQSVDVTIGADGTATVAADAFDYDSPNSGGQSFGGTAFTSGFDTAPMVVAAAAVASDGTPLGAVDRVYLTNPTGTPVAGGGGGTPGAGTDGYYQLIGSGSNARFKVQIEDADANGGSDPAGKWNFEDAPDADGHQAGFQGDGYYLYGSSSSTAINGVIESEILDYTIYVPEGETGTYNFRFRVARDGEEASDQQNDLLFNFFEEGSGGELTDYLVMNSGNSLHQGSGDFAKIFGGPNNGSWGFANKVDGSTGDPSLQVEIEEAGLYHVQIAGRSQGYHIDYWEAFKGGAPGVNVSDSAFVEGEPDDPVDPGTGEDGVLRRAIVAGSDDTDQNANGGSVNLGKTDLELGDGGRDIGLRFTDLDLESLEGVDITDAYIEFTARSNGGSSGTVEARIALEDSISAATFSSGNTPMDRDRFDFVEWSDGDVPGAGEVFRTADFSDMLEDFLVEWQDDLGTSDDIAFVIEDESGVRKAQSFEGGAAPVLVIEYDLLT
ncbi:cadherin-like domain-containing protein [uncultured Jannaschia sp.]|uniref:cadherin-like domain-containing protein n=1 Tax=uncultured Jannaschia sp. TaxID=293347 RepID=UPI002607D69B|nr:cadherin-like domain-containing protein [uncultured Jannaschia sp.]